MINLSNNCTCSELAVHPKDWKTCRASALSKKWYIHYYFYDNTLQKRKFVILKGMNRFRKLEERREATKQLLENELYQLKEKEYNPITGDFEKLPDYCIEPTTGFIDALNKAYELMKLESTTKVDIRTTIRHFEIAAKKLGVEKHAIQSIRLKHLMQMFSLMPIIKKRWSAYSFNNTRAYMMMLYKKLVLMQAVETNPIKDIPKEPVITKLRKVLTFEQRKIIDDYLQERDPVFRRFIHIFFHSGSRRTEICRVKGSDVFLDRQVFKVLVKKGRNQREELRPIKNVAVDFWKKQMKDCGPDDYVFSSTWKPGQFKLQPKHISNKWKLYVKEELKINVDLYALKHLNLDETSSLLNAEEAARMAGHSSPVITMKHYLINEEERKLERLKKVNNKFA
ncbi:MAG: tyrosine-type recombinase/integrase [Ginsengibacter sp.]